MKKRVVVFVITCLLYLIAVNPSSMNAASSDTLQLDGKSLKGTTERSSITYKISPKQSGTAKIKVFYASTSGVSATLTNRSSNITKRIESVQINGKSTIDFTYYVEKVDYELTIEFENGNKNTNYSVVGKLYPIESSEGVKNNSQDNPALVSNPDLRMGVLGFGDESDSYKISLKSESLLKINFVNLGPEPVNVKIYDAYKNLIKIETVPNIPLASNIEVPNANGNYYVSIDPVYVNGLGTNYKLTVGDYIPLTALKFSIKEITLTQGSSKSIKVNITPSNATEKFTYKSSNQKIATVNSMGKITAIKPGKATITAYSSISGVKTSLQLTVKEKAVTKVSLNVSKKSLEVDKTFQIKPSVSPSGVRTTFKYTSSNDKIATVDNKGKVTAISDGSCIITVTSKNGKKATCKVTVTKKPAPTVIPTPKPQPTNTPVPTIDVTSIKASNNMILLTVGDRKKIDYTILPVDATDQTVSFSSIDETVATVDKEGNVTAVKAGTTYVSGTTSNGKTMVVTVIIANK